MEKYISNNQRMRIHSCPKSYYYSHIKCLVPIRQKKALSIGSLVHKGLEALYTGPLYTVANLNNAYKNINNEFNNIDKSKWSAIDYETNKYASTISKALINAYYKTSYQDDKEKGVKVVELETPRTIKIRSPKSGRKTNNFYTFISDRVIIENNKLWVVSIKTASRITEGDIKKYMIDQQALSELIYLEEIYSKEYKKEIKFSGIIYNFLIKPGIKATNVPILDEDGKKIVLDKYLNRVLNANGSPKQSSSPANGHILKTRPETESEYLDRLNELINEDPGKYIKTIYRGVNDKEIKECINDIWNDTKYIQTAIKNNWFPKNTMSCNIYGECQYIELCRGSIDEEEIAELFKIKEGKEYEDEENPITE